MNKNNKNDDVVRQEFSHWINDFAKSVYDAENKCKDEKSNGRDTVRRYYVYALCERKENGSLIPFYIGKGTSDRVWAHQDEKENEESEFRAEAAIAGYSEEEIKAALAAVSEKHKRIDEIGDKLEKIVIKSGLTEYESFMCESALINIFRMNGLCFNSEKDEITNKVNGHANIFEKEANMKTAAYTVEFYFEEFCKKPIVLVEKKRDLVNKQSSYHVEYEVSEDEEEQYKDFAGKKILLQNINKFYKDCLDRDKFPTDEERIEAIKDTVRGFWRKGNPCSMDYVFAMYEGRIVGVYKVLPVYRNYKRNKSFYKTIDVWQPDYPQSEKINVRKKDYEIAKLIYDDCIDKDIINKQTPEIEISKANKEKLYSLLSPEVQKKYREYTGEESKDEAFYCNALKNYCDRKYFVLQKINEDDETNFNKYIGCPIKIKRGEEIESIFAARKSKAGKRGKASECHYLPYSENVKI